MSIFKNFYNKASKNNRIFTREDIKNMSTKEFIKHKKAIDYQMMNLGLPTNQELQKNDGVVNVNEYMRSDGTVVKAHYRSLPDGVTGVTAQNNISLKNYLQGVVNDTIGLNDPANTLFQTLGIFSSNYFNMKNANTIGADKYFHARANLESTQRGIVGEMYAKILSDLREYTDNYRNIHTKGYSRETSLKDIKEDQEANQEGRNLGRLYPTTNPHELLKYKVPKGFPDRYKK